MFTKLSVCVLQLIYWELYEALARVMLQFILLNHIIAHHQLRLWLNVTPSSNRKKTQDKLST